MINLVQNDTQPRLTFTITRGGVALDLSSASVKFKFRKLGDSAVKFSRSCVISTPLSGICYYDWQSGDLDETGQHEGEIEVTFTGGAIQTSREKLQFDVRSEL